MNKKVLIIGSRGMLATQVARTFNQAPGVDTYVVGRHLSQEVPAERTKIFRIEEDKPEFLGFDYIINCAGIIKPYINDVNRFSVFKAIYVNSVFPHQLRAMTGCTPIIQIATDCVFSGTDPFGSDELATHDALDVYGKTKSLGEVNEVNFYNIRCSIVGREPFNKKSLLEWFLAQPPESNLNGFLNHQWNGVTTIAFAKICLAVVQNDIRMPSLIHLVPDGRLTKFGLLSYFQDHFRTNHNIIAKDAPKSVNRHLKTIYDHTKLWQAAGYNSIPFIRELIDELE
jgi:dTDP-4-dehydrorhamnose reductase